jgi:hypothetical protein
MPVSVERTREANQFSDRHVPVKSLILANVGDAAADLNALPGIVDAIAKHSTGAGCGPDHPKQHLDRRALAGSVAAEEAGDPFGADPEIKLVDRAEAPVVLGEFAGLDDAFGNHDFLAIAVA